MKRLKCFLWTVALITCFFVFQVHSLPIGNPVTPHNMVKKLSVGFDCDWSGTGIATRTFSYLIPRDLKAAGYNTVRIRTQLPADNTLFSTLDTHIDTAIAEKLVVVLAFGAKDAELASTDGEAKRIVRNWWSKVASRYKNDSYKLVFNLLIEPSGRLKDVDLINTIYKQTIDEIRITNPYRILIPAAPSGSQPGSLCDLDLNMWYDDYIIIEWHIYAAGPNNRPTSKKYWTTGTLEDRNRVLNILGDAEQWINDNPGCKTWVGAWMPGNYNADDPRLNIPNQVKFATFFTRELNRLNVPFCVNTISKLYDREKKEWYENNSGGTLGGMPVRDIIVNPNQASFYTESGYGGKGVRLGVGKYRMSDLEDLGLADKISSLMVPWGFKVKVYKNGDFSGGSEIFTKTKASLSSIGFDDCILSLKVIDTGTY